MEEPSLEADRNRAELEARIRAMEEERNTLKAEIEILKAKALAELEAKSSALEDQLKKLRAEKMALQRVAEGAMAPAEQEQHE